MGRRQCEGTEPSGNWEAVVVVEGSGATPSSHHKPEF